MQDEMIRKELESKRESVIGVNLARLNSRSIKRSTKKTIQTKHHNFLMQVDNKSRIDEILLRARRIVDTTPETFEFSAEDKE